MQGRDFFESMTEVGGWGLKGPRCAAEWRAAVSKYETASVGVEARISCEVVGRSFFGVTGRGES